jgi:deoxyribodipyrimidine photo-lyase
VTRRARTTRLGGRLGTRLAMNTYSAFEGRIRVLNDDAPRTGRYVLYWMQQSQRAFWNHALEYAIERADELKLPVVACFGLTGRFPGANERHYAFMLEGLSETRAALARKGIGLVVLPGEPDACAVDLGKVASLVVTDRGYLRVQRVWRARAAAALGCPLIQVESDVVVPVETASPKEEYAAATLRPKIKRQLDAHLLPVRERTPKKSSTELDLDIDAEPLDLGDVSAILRGLDLDRSVKPVSWITGGSSRARKLLAEFIGSKLDRFADLRNDPSVDYLSHMSPYLHFGQISPLEIALAVLEADSPGTGSFIEELIVRRELGMNFVHYNTRYDAFDGLPSWALKTLRGHEIDRRSPLYSLDELEGAKTHDPFWNAAQREMAIRGKMHGYMRMYWGKKILEWSGTPAEAFARALSLNDKYSIDGRDPNGFSGVAWCFGKHDRPWAERPVFGSVRYMNANGLKRKFDIDAYVEKIEGMEHERTLK